MKFRIIENNLKVLPAIFDTFEAANKAAKELLKLDPKITFTVILECKKHQIKPESQLIGWGVIEK